MLAGYSALPVPLTPSDQSQRRLTDAENEYSI